MFLCSFLLIFSLCSPTDSPPCICPAPNHLGTLVPAQSSLTLVGTFSNGFKASITFLCTKVPVMARIQVQPNVLAHPGTTQWSWLRRQISWAYKWTTFKCVKYEISLIFNNLYLQLMVNLFLFSPLFIIRSVSGGCH